MNIQYKLTQSDFLAYQLYASSKSKLQKRRRLKSRILVTVIYFLAGVYLFFQNNDLKILISFFVVTIIIFLLYPKFSAWRYKNHFKKHIQESYKNRIGKLNEFSIEENHINIEDPSTNSIIEKTELKQLIETKNHFFIKLQSDLSLVIPKKFVDNKAQLKNCLMKMNVEYINEINWKWK